MDARLANLRDCATTLRLHDGGDHEATCLEAAAHSALELCAALLEARGAPRARGYKDACDKLLAAGLIGHGMCEQLKRIFDVADRVRLAWSTLSPGDLPMIREDGAAALLAFADEAERLLRGEPAPVPGP